MHPVNGRKAILLISSGIDTFSKASYQDALNAAQASDTPIYVLGLVQVLRQAADLTLTWVQWFALIGARQKRPWKS